MQRIIKTAFTLIELLVVIAIIGILSGLIVVTMSGVTQKATIAKSQVFSNSLRNALMLNLVSEWKFDGTTTDGSPAVAGDVLDIWGGKNGTIGNAPTVKTGSNCVNGSCLSFDGVGNYIDVSNTILNNSLAYSINFWIYDKGLTGTGNEILSGFESGKHNWQDIQCTNGVILWDVRNNTADGYKLHLVMDSGFALNVWHNIVLTWDGTITAAAGKIYVDGVVVKTATATEAAAVSNKTTNYRMGGHLNNTHWLYGLIDDFRIYNAAMPTSQIKEQYYTGLNSLLINGGMSLGEYRERLLEYSAIN